MMKFSKSIKRGLVILPLFLIVLVGTPSTWATPLYGGYNGESAAWTEYTIAEVSPALFNLKVTLGVDTDSHAWVRIVFSTVPFITRIEFTYDSFDILSGNFDTYLPWPIKIGSQIGNNDETTPLLRWFTAYVIFGVSGIDSERTIWTETGFPGVSGSGNDTIGNSWTWLKFLNWKFGVGEDLTEEGGDFLNPQRSKEIENELSSLQENIDHTYGSRVNKLTTLLTSREVILTVAETSGKTVFPDGNYHITSMGTTVFTEEVKAELRTLLDSFVQDVQPQLMKITEKITTN
jgi:hypothetical protein